MIVYIDSSLGINAQVESWKNSRLWPLKFTIDAANDKYLGAPTQAGSGDCTSGGSRCYGNATMYSSDYGRTWLSRRQGGDSDILISGNLFYEYDALASKYYSARPSLGSYFDMSDPDKVAPYMWIDFKMPGAQWSAADFGIGSSINKEDYRERTNFAQFEVFKKANPEKIQNAPSPLKKPIENFFHCVVPPIINHD